MAKHLEIAGAKVALGLVWSQLNRHLTLELVPPRRDAAPYLSLILVVVRYPDPVADLDHAASFKLKCLSRNLSSAFRGDHLAMCVSAAGRSR